MKRRDAANRLERPPGRRVTVALGVAGAALWILPLASTLGQYELGLLTQTFLFAAAALAWNWLGGYVGQVSFGHAAMFGVGGFTAARLLTSGLPLVLAIVVGGAVAGGYALLWGHPTLRLRGPYFAIATIGVGEATRLVATYWQSFTGGATGISLNISVDTRSALYWYALVLLGGTVALSFYLYNSRVGLALRAIRDDVEAAEDVGVNATLFQDLTLLLSGTVVGAAGGLYAAYFSFIEPTSMLGFERSISFILMGVVGGIGTVLGPILGAGVFTVIQELLVASYPQLYLGLYGVLLIGVILFEPRGMAGLFTRLRRSALGWGAPRARDSVSRALASARQLRSSRLPDQ